MTLCICRVMDREVDLVHWSIATTPPTIGRELKNLVTPLLGYYYYEIYFKPNEL